MLTNVMDPASSLDLAHKASQYGPQVISLWASIVFFSLFVGLGALVLRWLERKQATQHDVLISLINKAHERDIRVAELAEQMKATVQDNSSALREVAQMLTFCRNTIEKRLS